MKLSAICINQEHQDENATQLVNRQLLGFCLAQKNHG